MELVIDHVHDIKIIEPCCTFADIGSSGYIECGCAGMIEIECKDPTCPGIEDDFLLDDLYEKPLGGGSDCE